MTAKIDYPNLFAEGYRVEKVAQCFGGKGFEWWAYGPVGSHVNARFETKGEAIRACQIDFERRKAE